MILSEKTYFLYSSKCYDNPNCHSILEFQEDLDRVKMIKKILSRYKKSGELNERLLLNHLIVFYNCFGANGTNILFFKLEEYAGILKPIVEYLNYLPDILEYDNKIIYTKNITPEPNIKQLLEKL